MDQSILAVTAQLHKKDVPDQADKHRLVWKFTNMNHLSESIESFAPSLVFIDYKYLDKFLGSRPSKLEKIPLVVLLKKGESGTFPDFIEKGIIDMIRLPMSADDLAMEIYKVNHQYSSWKSRVMSEARNQEKTTILETILDILSHDTKNVFVKINALLQELGDNPVRGMLQDSVDELFTITKEAVGYLGNSRRIISVLETVQNIRLTGERIPLFSHRRINVIHDPPELFFGECSDLFKNAVTNIVENALKYTPEEGQISIKLEYRKQHIHIGIGDQGQGIPDDEKERIFERYFRREKTQDIEGSGRGLWITRNIIKKEGGDLWVEDNRDGGALFMIKIPAYKVAHWDGELVRLSEWFDLPLPKIQEKALAVRALYQLKGLPKDADLDSVVFTSLLDHLRKESHKRNSAQFKQKLMALKKENPDGASVLIADDSIYVHYYLGTFLAKLGYKISGYARDGLEAVNYYQALTPRVITLDCTMPVMSGIEAAKKIYSTHPDVRILFITGLGDSPAFRQEIAAIIPRGCYQVITKPFKEDQLTEAMATLLECEHRD